MKKLYLIAGHHNNDSGAVAQHEDYKVLESRLTIILRDLIHSYFKKFNSQVEVILDDDRDTLQTVINKVNKTITKNDLLVDIHFNAFNGKATGTEVIIPKISSSIEKELASNICDRLSDIMEIPNRGVKTEDKTARGRIAILKGVGHRILPEICFLDNLKDYRSYRKNEHLVASIIAQAIEKDWLLKKA